MIHDISQSLYPGRPGWPGDTPVAIHTLASLAAGDAANVSALTLSSHSGTHVDPPAHFIPNGQTVDRLELSALVGRCWVADLTGRPRITAAELERLSLPPGVERLLLKTDNSARWATATTFFPDYVALTPDAAEWVVARGVRLVGIDSLSIELYHSDPAHPTHHRLLTAGVSIVEGLLLSGIAPGVYTLVCLPLKIANGDGAPARAILIEPTGMRESF